MSYLCRASRLRTSRAQGPVTLKLERLAEIAGMAQAGVRVRGNANNASSARSVNSNNLASNCNANNGASAHVQKTTAILAAGSAENTRQGSKLERLLAKAAETPLMPMLKHLRMFTEDEIKRAMRKAAQGHGKKSEVKSMLAHEDEYARRVAGDIRSGRYLDKMSYRDMTITNRSRKRREVRSPSLYTRVLQIAWMQRVLPIYERHDPMIGLNCKVGCGITASIRNRSLLHRLKHVMYDRRDLEYGLLIDQRKCYEHITQGVFRRKLKQLVSDKWTVDFGTDVVFGGEKVLPIGTPSSPLAHHIVMLDFDCMCRSMAPVVLRYADNIFMASSSKAELQQAKWRAKNHWWYDLGIRAKRQDTRIFRLSEPLDLCGFVVHRNEGKSVTDHDKGYTRIRKGTATRARHCSNNDSWASYFGMLQHADGYRLIEQIEDNMKLQQLSAKIRIDRKMDAPKIEVRDLADNQVVFNIYDYEIRRDRDGKPNWIKCLIGINEVVEGQPTGKVLAREFHGNYSCLIEAMEAWEKEFGRDQMLPIEDAVIENQCGFIFKGSTNQLKYIEV